MLKILFVSLTLIVSFSFSASADINPVLAQKVISGGFLKESPKGIRILRSGVVESFSGKNIRVLGELYATSKDELVALIEKPASPLEDADPKASFCVDDSQILYTVFRISGEEVPVAKRVRCHHYASKDLTTVKNMLDAFSALSKSPIIMVPISQ